MEIITDPEQILKTFMRNEFKLSELANKAGLGEAELQHNANASAFQNWLTAIYICSGKIQLLQQTEGES